MIRMDMQVLITIKLIIHQANLRSGSIHGKPRWSNAGGWISKKWVTGRQSPVH